MTHNEPAPPRAHEAMLMPDGDGSGGGDDGDADADADADADETTSATVAAAAAGATGMGGWPRAFASLTHLGGKILLLCWAGLLSADAWLFESAALKATLKALFRARRKFSVSRRVPVRGR